MKYESYKKTPNTLGYHRKKRGLTQRRVASLLHLQNNTLISRWEKGESFPSLLNTAKLSAIYQVPIDLLFENLLTVVRHTVSIQKRGEEDHPA